MNFDKKGEKKESSMREFLPFHLYYCACFSWLPDDDCDSPMLTPSLQQSPHSLSPHMRARLSTVTSISRTNTLKTLAALYLSIASGLPIYKHTQGRWDSFSPSPSSPTFHLHILRLHPHTSFENCKVYKHEASPFPCGLLGQSGLAVVVSTIHLPVSQLICHPLGPAMLAPTCAEDLVP